MLIHKNDRKARSERLHMRDIRPREPLTRESVLFGLGLALIAALAVGFVVLMFVLTAH